jgi:hypothetical protein
VRLHPKGGTLNKWHSLEICHFPEIPDFAQNCFKQSRL